MLTRNLKMWLLVTALLSSLFMFSTTSYALGLTSTNSISSSGTIMYGNETPLFSSSFEATTPNYPEHLSGEGWNAIHHLINTQPLSSPHLAGAFYDIVTDQAHSGTKSLYLELSDVTKNRRNQLCIFNEIFGSEVYVSVWLYLPSDYALQSPTNRWNEIADPAYTRLPEGGMCLRLYIIQDAENEFHWKLINTPQGYAPQDIQVSNYDVGLPRGRWFNLRYYVLRRDPDVDGVEGRCIVWVDNEVLFDVTGNTGASNEGFYTAVAKHYFEPNDYATHQLWVDDLEVYDTLPFAV